MMHNDNAVISKIAPHLNYLFKDNKYTVDLILTGSQYFNTATSFSDYDFFVDSEEPNIYRFIEKLVKEHGFYLIITAKTDYKDLLTFAVLRNEALGIDIQIVYYVEIKILVQKRILKVVDKVKTRGVSKERLKLLISDCWDMFISDTWNKSKQSDIYQQTNYMSNRFFTCCEYTDMDLSVYEHRTVHYKMFTIENCYTLYKRPKEHNPLYHDVFDVSSTFKLNKNLLPVKLLLVTDDYGNLFKVSENYWQLYSNEILDTV